MSERAVEFKYSEARIAEQIGVARTDLKFLRDRKLSENRDWKKSGADIAISVAGLKKIWRLLEARPSLFDLEQCLLAASKKNGAAANGNGATAAPILLGSTLQPIPEKVRVTRICENPQVVLALDAHNRVRSIYVGRNCLFSVGMMINVVPHLQQPGWFRYAGALPQRRYTADEWERRQRAGLAT